MKTYTTDRIRNVVVLGHGGCGKTSLIDSMCWVAGTSSRHGRADDGTALTMHAPEEHAHGVSIQTTPAFAEFADHKINIIDTPGYLDFTGETLAGLRVADAAIIVVSATAGVEVGTERVLEFCRERGIPRFFFISMMDKEHANFERVFEQIKEISGKALPVEIPVGAGPGFSGIVTLFRDKLQRFKPGTSKGEYDEAEIPAELTEMAEEWRTELMETVATTDEELLDLYLEELDLPRDVALSAMATAVSARDAYPVLCGSSHLTYGIRAVLNKIVELFPSPVDAGPEKAGEETIEADADGPLTALVFKTTQEPHVGDLSFFRVYSGTLENGTELTNTTNGETERLAHLAVPLGKERREVDKLVAGDIGVVSKLKATRTNDTLSAKGTTTRIDPIVFPTADISIAIRGKARSDDDKLGEVIHRLHEEDPTFSAAFNGELGQTIARGLGELHLGVQFERMARKYGVHVETEQPKIAYRETLSRPAQGQGRHKKQSGGRGQFGDCRIRLTPRERGAGYEFVDSIKGGVIPSKYLPSVDRGIQEAATNGVLAGYPMVDFAAECYDGSYHSVDSSDIAFKLAGSLAFRNVAVKAGPVLLEPIVEVSVTTPDEYVGDIMGDLTSRRGRVQGMEPASGRTTIMALVPQSELYKYAATLRSITQGRAFHTRKIRGYEPAPHEVAQKVAAERAKE
ncbi:MAG: elongation factor G [Gemmatimonadetes bacterium]|nr:elongation factor G [Gemmatimonadota bacterium]